MAHKSKPTKSKSAGAAAAPASKRQKTTKKATLIKLLKTSKGAELAALSKKLGWQPHTTRAAMSGLRKAGYEIVFEPSEGAKPGRYRLTASPKPEVA